MNGNSLQCKALDKASVSMAMGERVGLRGYSILSYAIFGQRRSHGWTFTRKSSIEIIRVEAEALERLYPAGITGADTAPV